jgi:hypothetical protein
MVVWRNKQTDRLLERSTVDVEINGLMDFKIDIFIEQINRSTDGLADISVMRIVENHSHVWFGGSEISPNFVIQVTII